MKGYLVSDSKFEPPADGWVQVLALGEFPNAEAGIVQVCDGQALDAIVADFKAQAATENWPGMLLDYDHFSHQKDKPTGAAGWADSVERRGDGLFAHVRFSESGDKAVRGGEYRLISPVLSGFVEVDGQRKRPTKLVRLALTNDPNIKGMEPVSNRAGQPKTQHQENNMEYKDKLTALLGLNRDASDDDIEKALGEVETEAKNRAEAAQAEAKEQEEAEALEAQNRGESPVIDKLQAQIARLESELAETHAAQFDALLGDNKDAKVALRELCVMNRGAVAKVMAAVKPAPAQVQRNQPIYNRRTQPLPGAASPDADSGDSVYADAVQKEALSITTKNRDVTWSQAWGMAKRTVAARNGAPAK